MSQIAEKSGLGRATLYKSREGAEDIWGGRRPRRRDRLENHGRQLLDTELSICDADAADLRDVLRDARLVSVSGAFLWLDWTCSAVPLQLGTFPADRR